MTPAAWSLAARLLAPDDDAWRDNEHFVRGTQAYAAEQWDEAAREFELASDEQPHAVFLWAWAQSLRFGGHCDEAVVVYRRYVELDVSALERRDARANIRECGGEPEPAPLPPPVVAAVDVPPPPVAVPAPVARDGWGHGLTWSGLAIAAAGGGLLGAAHARAQRADTAGNEVDYARAIDPAPAMSRAGIATLGVGAALLTAGIVRFAVLTARARRTQQAAARPRLQVQR